MILMINYYLCYKMKNKPGHLSTYTDSAAICIAYDEHAVYDSVSFIVLWIDFYDKKIYIT